MALVKLVTGLVTMAMLNCSHQPVETTIPIKAKTVFRSLTSRSTSERPLRWAAVHMNLNLSTWLKSDALIARVATNRTASMPTLMYSSTVQKLNFASTPAPYRRWLTGKAS